MLLRKILVTALLFVATNAGVMAADPYAFFGGKGVDYRAVVAPLKLRHIADGMHELTLNEDVAANLKKVEASQFTKTEKVGGGGGTYAAAGNIIAFMKDFYGALEVAAGEVKARHDTGGRIEEWSGAEALSLWIQNLKPADKVIRVNLKNRKTSAELITGNAAVKTDAVAKVKLDVLDIDLTADLLRVLNGTPGAQRAATGPSPAYLNAQAAYNAYQAAKRDGNAAAARKVLEDAETLRFGTNSRTIEYLADKELRKDFTTAEMRDAKAKVASKGGGVRGVEVKVANDAYALLLQKVEDGHFAPLAKILPDLYADFDDATTAFRDDGVKAGKLIDALVAFAKQQRQLKNDIVLLQQSVTALNLKKAEDEVLAIAAAAKSKSKSSTTGGSGGKGPIPVDDTEGMGLFLDSDDEL